MKKLIILCITVLSVLSMSLTGCSAIFHTVEAGNNVAKTYDLKDFRYVEISNAVQCEVKRADTYSVIASTQENNLNSLDIYQSGDTLHVGRKTGLINLIDPKVTINVTMPQLNKLEISGASKVYATGFDSTSDLDVSASGASWLNMKIKAGKSDLDISGSSSIYGELSASDTQISLSGASSMDMTLKTGMTQIYASGSSRVRGDLQSLDCQLELSGASSCELTGSSGNTSIKASGSSHIDVPDLTLQSADVLLEGASSASIYTNGMLNIDLSGSSRLNYAGNAIIGKTDISGDSKLNHIQR
jgi:hypothetical protein